jgi:hypothetical protein
MQSYNNYISSYKLYIYLVLRSYSLRVCYYSYSMMVSMEIHLPLIIILSSSSSSSLCVSWQWLCVSLVDDAADVFIIFIMNDLFDDIILNLQ